MNIRGLYKTSLIDFPGRISSVIFTGGCNLKCGYCHNGDLARNSSGLERLADHEVLDFLRSRKGIIDGVTLSGGEPTLDGDLIPFLKKIREIPLEIKIDSNGLFPEIMKEIVESGLADYAAVDVKTSPSKYEALTGCPVDFSRIAGTVEVLRSSGIDYEVRTTCIPGYCSPEDMEEIARSLGRVKRYYLQQFISDVPLMDPSFAGLRPFPIKKLEEIMEHVKSFTDCQGIRGI